MDECVVRTALGLADRAMELVGRIAEATLTTECPECGHPMGNRRRVRCPSCRAISDYDPNRVADTFDEWIQEARRILA